MATNAEVIRLPDNVQAFVQSQTVHSQRLVRDGYVWREPIPMFLRPYTEVTRGFVEDTIQRQGFIQGVAKGHVTDEEDLPPRGSRDIFGVEMMEPLHFDGESMRVTPQSFRKIQAQDRVAQMLTHPFESWARATNEYAIDVPLMGAFSDGSNNPSDSFTPSATTFDGATINQRLPTDSADTARALTANSNHLVQFADRHGNLLDAGHDHVEVAVGGAWTRARHRTARDDITEHPGQQMVDAFFGANPAGVIHDTLESASGLDGSGVSQIPAGQDFLATGRDSLVSADFGVPIPLGMIDEVRCWSVADIPDDIGLYVMRGGQPFRSFVGIKGAGNAPVEAPFAWNEPLHRALRGANDNAGFDVGYRGHFGYHTQNPVGTTVVEFKA